MLDILSVGSGTIDVFVDTEDQLFCDCDASHVKVPFGSKIPVRHMFSASGGGGTNTAVGFRRMGLRSGWLGVLGKDYHSSVILEELKKEKVNLRYVQRIKGQAGFSVVLDAKQHERTILTYKGVNNHLALSKRYITQLVKKTRYFYFCSMQEQSLQTQLAIAKQLTDRRILFNPSIYTCTLGVNKLRAILKKTCILCLNKEEIQLLCSSKKEKDYLRHTTQLGIPVVVVTDGKRGASAYASGKKYTIIPKKVAVQETTGAGDSFAVGFITQYLRSLDPTSSLQYGLANASSVITHRGAKNKLLSYAEAKAYVRKHGVSVTITTMHA